MIIDNNPQPKSSFLSMEKDMRLITNMFLKNNRLKKMLYYTTSTYIQAFQTTWKLFPYFPTGRP